MSDPTIGDIYRDKYADSPTWKNPRKIEIIEVLPNGVRAKVLRNTDGSDLTRPRITIIKFSTLKSGYVLWDVAKENPDV